MNRTKRAFINSFTAALYSVIQIAVGIILPRLIIGRFGSNINGLTVSIQQFVSYLSYLELGLSSVFIYSLYRPLASKDECKINSLVSSAKRSYNRTSIFYLIGVIVLASIYPFIANTGEIDFWIVIALVFIIGLSGLLEMFSVAKYRVLLTADQKVYVLNLSFAASIILTFVLAIILIALNQHIILVKASAIVSILLRTTFLHFYTKKKYPYIKFNQTSENSMVQTTVKRFDAVLMQLSKTVAYSLPILALSILSSMKTVSIFSVYYLVFHGLQTIISTITSGSTATFGEMISKNELSRARNAYSQFELVLINTQTILYAVSIMLIIPFVTIYVGGLPDAHDYINMNYGLLFAIWAFIDNFRLPAQTIIQAAGKFKESRWSNVLYMLIEVILLAILTPFFGISGALIAMIIASFVKAIWFIIIVEKHVFSKLYLKSVLRFFQGSIIIAGCFFVFRSLINVEILTIPYFIMWGFILVIAVFVIVFAANFIIDSKQSINIIRRIISRKRKS